MASTSQRSAPAKKHDNGRIRDMIAINFGNTLEWYDWTIYTIFAPFFAAQFFNPDDKAAALLSTLAVFAVGFVTRPLGGFLFGAYADRVGRKKSLTLAMILTACGSVAIAIAPGYAKIGAGAAILLLIIRLVQGLAHGGEMGTSVTYLVERAAPNRRALFGSTSWFSVVLGTILATLSGLVLNSVFTVEELSAWGWRIPFAVGGLLGFYALFLRLKLVETEAFTTTQQQAVIATQETPKQKIRLWSYWRGILVVFGLSAGGSVMFYIWLIYMPTHAQVQLGQDAVSALTASLIAQVYFIIVVLGAGYLGDKIGRRPMVIAFGALFVLFSIPMWNLVDGTFLGLLLGMLFALTALAILFGVNGAVWAEVFPTPVRAAGVAGPLSLATAIFGGTAPYINTALAQQGHQDWFIWYLIGVAAITLVTGLVMKETRHLSLTREE